MKATDCFVSRDLAEHAFQHPDGVTPEAPGFPYSSEDYRSEAVYRPTSDDVDSAPVTSGRNSGDIWEFIAVVSFISIDDAHHGTLLDCFGLPRLQEHCLMPRDLSVLLTSVTTQPMIPFS